MFEPQKFFISLIDFFAIILPGALFTFLFKDRLGPYALGEKYWQLTGTKGWVAFLGMSYLFGHFVFLIGSWLLDDVVYDPARHASYAEQIKNLAKGKVLSPIGLRGLSLLFFGRGRDLAVTHAAKIKEHHLGPLEATDAVNAFQWSKAQLALDYPAALESVHRFEADSKFFRSLVVLCLLVILFSRPIGPLTWVTIPILILGLRRYIGQRLKATKQAYWYVLTLEGKAASTLPDKAATKADSPSHAGGVVYRKLKDRKVEYLLVRAKPDRRRKPLKKEWVLPKGHIELGEDPKETAVREVFEEAGVWARVKAPLREKVIPVKGKNITVQFYLMEAVDTRLDRAVSGLRSKWSRLLFKWIDLDRREREWVPLHLANEYATHTQTKEVLEVAGAEVKALRPGEL